jgi:hypothetical protein
MTTDPARQRWTIPQEQPTENETIYLVPERRVRLLEALHRQLISRLAGISGALTFQSGYEHLTYTKETTYTCKMCQRSWKTVYDRPPWQDVIDGIRHAPECSLYHIMLYVREFEQAIRDIRLFAEYHEPPTPPPPGRIELASPSPYDIDTEEGS